ncbi:MAG: hypothetical protein IJY82_07555 [Oscillospiraceae bacterium]|nr:hypothetical protein [Oscillospiraceae bacterium]
MKKAIVIAAISLMALCFSSCGMNRSEEGSGLSGVFDMLFSLLPNVNVTLEEADYQEMIDSFVPDSLNVIELEIGQADSPNAAVWLKSGMGTTYSSNESVVTVTDLGKVTAVGEGTAYVVITGVGTMFEVYRYDVVAEGANTLDYGEMIDSFVPDFFNVIALEVGQADSPSAAVWLKGNGSGTAYSSDESVVTVTNLGKVTAVGEGTAYVVITGVGTMFEVYRYDVTAPSVESSAPSAPQQTPSQQNPAPSASEPSAKPEQTIDYQEMIDSFVPDYFNVTSLRIGDSHRPNAAVWLSGNAGTIYTSNDAIVTVSADGKVTAVGEGTAYVVITGLGSMYEVYRYDVNA